MCVKQICMKIQLGYGTRALFVFFRQMVDVSDIQEIGYHQRAFLGATINLCWAQNAEVHVPIIQGGILGFRFACFWFLCARRWSVTRRANYLCGKRLLSILILFSLERWCVTCQGLNLSPFQSGRQDKTWWNSIICLFNVSNIVCNRVTWNMNWTKEDKGITSFQGSGERRKKRGCFSSIMRVILAQGPC